MKRSRFTLLEVILAMAVFAVGLGGALSAAAMARMRSANAVRDYAENMQLINTAEYFMLDSEADSLPEELLTLPGYSVEVEYDDVESLPDDIDSELGQYELVLMRVSLLNDSNEVCKTVAIERIMQRR